MNECLDLHTSEKDDSIIVHFKYFYYDHSLTLSFFS